MLNFYPGYIDNTNFKFITVDNLHIVTMCLINYPKQMKFLELANSLPKDIQYDMSIFIQKQDTIKILKELTYNISNSRAEKNTINKNQIDVDVIDKVTNDAKRLRYEIQINNEQIYHTYTYISVRGYNIDDVTYASKKFRSVMYAKMFISNLLNFRHLQGYISTLPLNILDSSFSKSSYINMTTSNITNMFPFYTDTVYDVNGIILGYTDNSKKICNLDIFNSKYTNSNICVFGSSGSGKSYLVKLLIMRHYIRNIKQYIFDPEGEYINIAAQVGGEYVSFNSNSKYFLNLLDIDEIDILEDNFLNKKIRDIYELLDKMLKIDSEYSNYVLDAIRKSYLDKGINDNVESMYLLINEDKIYLNKAIKSKDYMPTFQDVYENLFNSVSNKIVSNRILLKFKQLMMEYTFLNKKTNVNINSELIVFDLSGINDNISNILFKFIIDNIIRRIQYHKEKSIIYIDEIWKFIHNNPLSAEKIFLLFKTIRKLNAGIVAITQEISDLFSVNLGTYGKSIINNSFIKIFFKMEYSDYDILSKTGVLSNNELTEISKLSKGSMIMSFQSNILHLNVKSNEYEDKLIRGIYNDNTSSG